MESFYSAGSDKSAGLNVLELVDRRFNKQMRSLTIVVVMRLMDDMWIFH